MSWYHRIRPNKKTQGDLDRYVNPNDGSICQTVFSTSRFMDSRNVSTATLLLVNNWYRSNHPTIMNKAVMEKAIGKIYIEYLCFTYDSAQYHNIPNTMKEANDIIHQR
ncbi:hypothetical protein RMCBS344292_00349 [Rhizopus microsporus]|nr:hypothetical protein RMCBS344292_00349 [Rhizopus microsporus]